MNYDWFYRQHLDTEDAVLLVSQRKTKRYLLFDSAMRLMGWTNIETGEVKSPFPWLRESEVAIDEEYHVSVSGNNAPTLSRSLAPSPHTLYAFAFSGIHSFSPRLFQLMEQFPDRFPIMDFYLSVCHRARIYGCQKEDLRILDVGKLDSLEQAENFV